MPKLTKLFGVDLSEDESEGFAVEKHHYHQEFWKRLNAIADDAMEVDLTNLDRFIKRAHAGDAEAALKVSAWMVLFNPLDPQQRLNLPSKVIATPIVKDAKADFTFHTYMFRKPSVAAYERLKHTEYGDQYLAHCAFYCLLTPEQDHSGYANLVN